MGKIKAPTECEDDPFTSFMIFALMVAFVILFLISSC